MNIPLKNDFWAGKLVSSLSVETTTYWMHRPGQDARYKDSGVTDPATGCRTFVYAPLPRRRAR
jgi:hypothetical protein